MSTNIPDSLAKSFIKWSLTALLATFVLWSAPSCSSDPAPLANLHSECATDMDCDDQLACTEDKCVVSGLTAGRCESIPHDELCQSDEQCTPLADSAGGCIKRVRLWCLGKNEQDSCSPQDACALGSGVCHNTTCEYDRKECQDRVCLVTRGCNRLTGQCEYLPAPAGQKCEIDDDPCTDDTCGGGVCTAGEDLCECSDARPCPIPEDLCEGVPVCNDGMCESSPVSCPVSANPCREFVCDSSTGTCKPVPVREGLACPDTLTCTIKETCHDGKCTTTLLTCESRACATALCMEPDGCAYIPFQDGLQCDDGNVCNGNDACLSGHCVAVGPVLDCDDSNPCTTDSCELTGCRHEMLQNCCGNLVIEHGEECDPPSMICSECHFGVVDLAGVGGTFAMAISASASVWTAYETSDDGLRRLWLRRTDPVGNLDEPAEVFSVAENFIPGNLSPGLGILADGHLLLAHFDGSGIPVRVVDQNKNARLLATVANPFPDGEHGQHLKIAVGPDASLVAYDVVGSAESGLDGRKVLFAIMQASRDRLVVGQAVPVEPEATTGARRTLGDVCVGQDGFLIAYSRLISGNRFQQLAVPISVVGQAGSPILLGEFTGDTMPPPRCAPLDDGRWVVAFSVIASVGGRMGIVVKSAVVSATTGDLSVPVDLFSSDGVNGSIGYPVIASMVADGERGVLFLSTFFDDLGSVQPDGIRLLGIRLDSSGLPYGDMFSVPSATEGLLADIAAVGEVNGDVSILLRQIPQDSPDLDVFGTILLRMFAGYQQ